MEATTKPVQLAEDLKNEVSSVRDVAYIVRLPLFAAFSAVMAFLLYRVHKYNNNPYYKVQLIRLMTCEQFRLLFNGAYNFENSDQFYLSAIPSSSIIFTCLPLVISLYILCKEHIPSTKEVRHFSICFLLFKLADLLFFICSVFKNYQTLSGKDEAIIEQIASIAYESVPLLSLLVIRHTLRITWFGIQTAVGPQVHGQTTGTLEIDNAGGLVGAE